VKDEIPNIDERTFEDTIIQAARVIENKIVLLTKMVVELVLFEESQR